MMFWFVLLAVAALPAFSARHSHVPVNILIHHASHLIEGQHNAVTSNELDQFKIYAQYAGSSYCGKQEAKKPLFCEGNICPAKGQNATYFSSLKTDGFISDWFRRNTCMGYVSVDHDLKAIVVSLRGTVFWEWYYNFKVFRTSWEETTCVGCEVHIGFNDVANFVRPSVTQAITQLRRTDFAHRYDIVVTGHSLGGAAATILAAYLRMDLGTNVTTYTFGSPRVGNAQFAEFVQGQGDRNYRITHYDDLVPKVPGLSSAWRHVEPEYWLPQPGCEKIDYTTEDIDKCLQSNTTSCVESFGIPGTLGFGRSICSHGYYLTPISACGDKLFKWWQWLWPPDWFRGSGKMAWDEKSVRIPAGLVASVQSEHARDIAYAASLFNDSFLAQHSELWQGD